MMSRSRGVRQTHAETGPNTAWLIGDSLVGHARGTIVSQNTDIRLSHDVFQT
jgi:hypothetical protein